MKNEHCWAGELNGLRGWFPAKFVEILDECSKDILDFERHDDDELGFKKNDIINVISMN